MISISVIICTHNPRPDYLRRVLDALKAQTLPKEQWESAACRQCFRKTAGKELGFVLAPQARQIREDELGLTPARLRGIAEAEGGLLVFIDDDNILAPDYLERAAAIPGSYSHIGVFGAGTLEPEFEEEPEPAVRPWLRMLALRTVSRPNMDQQCGGLLFGRLGERVWCVPRQFAARYSQFVRELRTSEVLDPAGRKSILRWRRRLFVAVRWKRCRVWDLSGTANHTFDSGRTRAARLPCTACARTQLLTCSTLVT